ncbi:MAG: divalent-cation tolerance protein CutA [Saccharolobus sp.]
MQEGIIVLTTTSTEENAKLIAKTLVEEKLAACVNITTIKSYYIWDNKLNEDNEFLLIIKTAKEKYESVEKRIKELHIYQLPEIISVKIDNGSKEYMSWIFNSVRLNTA